MTINKMTNSLKIDKKFLNVSEEHFSDDGERNRKRSERASSLALPHSSLLDFYDKQQEQCNSVALLPTTVSSIVRRHSSHCYPMLEDNKQQQTETQEITQRQQELQEATLVSLGAVNAQKNKYCNSTTMQSGSTAYPAFKASAVVAKGAATALTAEPLTPPPPIPKRNFRGKYAWHASEAGSMATVDVSTATKNKQQQQQQQRNTTHFFAQQTDCSGCDRSPAGGAMVSDGNGDNNVFFPSISTVPNPQSSALFVGITTRPSYSDCAGTDAEGISDDDRMSLENSVFDESLTSTPVKVAAFNMPKYTGHAAANNFSPKILAALNAGGGCSNDLSHVGKRSNRSSSSTVESATLSSGYGSAHSERFASTSTTADFRSRFSSVDTQSSLDSSGIAEKNTDSPTPKESFKLDRGALHDVMHNLNNNDFPNHDWFASNNNNNSLARSAATTAAAEIEAKQTVLSLPAVPARKPYGGTLSTKLTLQNGTEKLEAPAVHSRIANGENKTSTASVSASTSTSSTASAGSSSLSSATMSSISGTASSAGLSPLSINSNTLQQKRPVPPAPPTRTHNSVDSNNESIQVKLLPSLTIRNKLNRNKPPPIVYPRLHQRQDSNLSSDSFSVSSSPGYNSKNLMDMPLLQNPVRTNKSGGGNSRAFERSQESSYAVSTTPSRFGYGNSAVSSQHNKLNYRQDSTISSDSFSQTSSPGYNTKLMEAPLLPTLSSKRICSVPAPIVICKQKLQNETIEEMDHAVPMSPLTKCVSTPASLQTIVRFQNGTPNTMSLQHQIINRRKSSNPYITNGRLKFRLFQILINAFALLAIAGGLAAYFNAYPTIKFVNKTIINTVHVEDTSSFGKNPAPGTCLPIIVKFCQGPKIPYNYTVFPNYIGHFGQLETQVDLDAYEALVDVRCYELVSLFLCTLFVPKCGATGATVPPCKTLCTETMRRCGFFFDVFGLSLPEYLNCKLFKDFANPEDCVGLDQVRDVMIASANPKCEGFQCDQNRCLPKEYVCDGHLDCMDQADEATCARCDKDEIYCGDDRCIGKMHVCDGEFDCPYGQDERNCLRLSERNGDLGKGVLEVFRINTEQWMPACVKNWDRAVSPSAVCSMLGYSSVNATSVVTQRTHRPLLASVNVSTDIWKMYSRKRSNIMKEFSTCKLNEDYPIAELTCSNYQCGKVKRARHSPSRRIIGGNRASPGTWPFLAAILGGPEKIFYCAGVLISDQWVLTASHCIGNHTVIDLEDWTIQLGVTRRNSFTYTGIKVKVKTVIPHPLYNTNVAHDNDIALFQLATRVAFHEHLLPVCLPPPNVRNLHPNQMCTVIGWGKREDKDPKSTYEHIVNEVQVPIIRRQQCDEWLDNLTVSDGMVCAGYEDGGKDACQGDSGGPLLCPYPGEKDRWFVGGIVSWGIMCAHPKLPGVYANVIKYVPWIQEQMQKYTKPIHEERLMKYDSHPGGPDILSNMATSPMRNKKPYYNQNRSPMDIDYYESYKRNSYDINPNRN